MEAPAQSGAAVEVFWVRVLYEHREFSREFRPGNPGQRIPQGTPQGIVARESRPENPPGNSPGKAAQGMAVRDQGQR